MTAVFDGLIKFRAALKHPKKGGKNPHLNSKYVTLDDLIAAVDEACIEAGLGWFQQIEKEDHGVSAKTTIFSAGGSLEIPGPAVPVSKSDAQGLGSAVTYARRYALAVAFGVASEEDDDGHAAAKAAPERRREPAATKPADEPTREPSHSRKKWVAQTLEWAASQGVTEGDVARILTENGLPGIWELKADQCVRLGNLLHVEIERRAKPPEQKPIDVEFEDVPI